MAIRIPVVLALLLLAEGLLAHGVASGDASLALKLEEQGYAWLQDGGIEAIQQAGAQ